MKRSKMLLAAALLSTAYLAYLGAMSVILLPRLGHWPETVQVFGKPVSFQSMALHAAGVALAAMLGWVAYAASVKWLSFICALALGAACYFVVDLTPFALPGAVLFLLAPLTGRRRRSKKHEAEIPDPKEQGRRADPVTIIMTAFAALMVVAILGVVYWGLFPDGKFDLSMPNLSDNSEQDEDAYVDEPVEDEYYIADEDFDRFDAALEEFQKYLPELMFR